MLGRGCSNTCTYIELLKELMNIDDISKLIT